ncbi:SocA family protein, partial [bacterium]|nr:SocA family protein [bacterium]
LKNMIFYLASLDGGILKTKLNKLLFYADFIHYRNHSVSISGARYINLPFGPVPDNYEMHLFDLRVEGKIEQLEIPFNDEMTGENLVAIGNFDTSSLPDSAINVLTAVFNHFKEMGSVKISELSHQQDGYKETKKLEPISYEYADKLKVEIEID